MNSLVKNNFVKHILTVTMAFHEYMDDNGGRSFMSKSISKMHVHSREEIRKQAPYIPVFAVIITTSPSFSFPFPHTFPTSKFFCNTQNQPQGNMPCSTLTHIGNYYSFLNCFMLTLNFQILIIK